MAGIATLAIAYVLSQFYRSFLAVLTPALTAELGANKAQLSFASGAYFIAFALAQFAIGVSLDRFGPKLTASMLLACGGAGGALPAARRGLLSHFTTLFGKTPSSRARRRDPRLGYRTLQRRGSRDQVPG